MDYDNNPQIISFKEAIFEGLLKSTDYGYNPQVIEIHGLFL